jgi:PPM family protein phosphatase
MNAFRLGMYASLSFVAAVITAIVTPSTDAITMVPIWLAISVVLCVLFEVAWTTRRRLSRPSRDDEVPQREEPPVPEPPLPEPEGTFLAVRTFGLTDPGRVRSTNEDHFLVADLSRTLRVRQTSLPQVVTQQGRNQGHILLVADGMGGHNAGEVASALTVETVELFVVDLLRRFSNLRTADEKGVIQDLREAVQQADARIAEEAREHRELKGMGTTLTMAFVSGRRLFILHAGDSRCYLFRGGKLERLTEDHTLVAALLSHGTISSEQARDHPYRHVVTNVLGGDEAGVRVDVQRASLEPGDVLLLCSDGLTDMLDDKRISAILAEEPEPEAACRRLVGEANESGGKDNITAVVARFDTR